MAEIRFTPRRRLPETELPGGPWARLFRLEGEELAGAVREWLAEAGLDPSGEDPIWVGETAVRVVEGGPVHGFSPAMLRRAVPGHLTVLVVSPFPGAGEAHLHAVRPHPDLVAEAGRRGVRLTRVWDLVAGGPEFARTLVEPGEGGFLAVPAR